MHKNEHLDATQSQTSAQDERGAYTPPTLSRLGPWTALTLVVSIPVGPFKVAKRRFPFF